MLSFGTVRRAVAPPCLSTRTRSDRHFPGLAGACARGGGSYDHMPVSRGYMRAQNPLLMAPWGGNHHFLTDPPPLAPPPLLGGTHVYANKHIFNTSAHCALQTHIKPSLHLEKISRRGGGARYVNLPFLQLNAPPLEAPPLASEDRYLSSAQNS